MDTVGAYDAKTHLPRLLDQVEAGASILITKHGRPVARLVPVRHSRADTVDIIASLRTARASVRRGDLSVAQMRAEGRR